MDYASHVIDLINYILGTGSKSTWSHPEIGLFSEVEDAVYSLLELSNKMTGVLIGKLE